MALVVPVTYPASCKREFPTSTPTFPSFSQIMSPQTPLMASSSTATETQVPTSTLHLNQPGCSSAVETSPRQTSSCDIRSDPILNCDAGKSPDRREAGGRKGTLKSLRQVGKQISRFQKAKSKWPDPEESLGKFCGMNGKYSCWEAKGPAQETFNVLGKEIAALLERTCGPVPASSQVIYDIFMVGETPDKAVPQIMFSCRKDGPRKEAMESLKKSGILSRYPGIETGHWQFPPHILDPRLLANGEEPSLSTQRKACKVLLIPAYLSDPSTRHIPAMGLYTVDSSGAPDTPLRATVGSFTFFAGKMYYVSVSHTFVETCACDIEPLLGISEEGDSGFEFGGFSDVEEDLDDPVGEESDISGSMTSESSGSHEDFNDDLAHNQSSESLSLVGSNASLRMSTGVSYPPKRNNVKLKSPAPSKVLDFATTYLESIDLDYSLIKSSERPEIWSILFDLPLISSGNSGKIPPGQTRIMTVTGSNGLLYGTLSGRPSYIRFMSSKTYQETYTVIIDGPLMPGDSGSMVLNAETRELYGHIVVGSTASRIAYIIPAINVLNDLKNSERR
jgi:hypothetical protein